jgi:hypothetical protein
LSCLFPLSAFFGDILLSGVGNIILKTLVFTALNISFVLVDGPTYL